MCLRIRLVSVFSAILIAAPVYAQTYKWIDENGVTNYSANPPATATAAKKFETVADRISVYTPQRVVAPALGAGSQGGDGLLSSRIDSLQRQLDAERSARQYAAEASAIQASFDRCAAERRVDCGDYRGPYFYAPAVTFVPFIQRQPRFVPAVAVTGVTAGNVTAAIRAGGGSFNGTPGAIASNALTFRSFAPARMSRGFSSR